MLKCNLLQLLVTIKKRVNFVTCNELMPNAGYFVNVYWYEITHIGDWLCPSLICGVASIHVNCRFIVTVEVQMIVNSGIIFVKITAVYFEDQNLHTQELIDPFYD